MEVPKGGPRAVFFLHSPTSPFSRRERLFQVAVSLVMPAVFCLFDLLIARFTFTCTGERPFEFGWTFDG